MSKTTVRTIVILVSLLFLNIEAAQAGLLTKLRLLIRAEIPESSLAVLCLAIASAVFLVYVIFSPVPINGRHRSFRGLPGSVPGFSERRDTVRRIASRLRTEPPARVREMKTAA